MNLPVKVTFGAASKSDLFVVKADQFAWSWGYKIRDVVASGDLDRAPAVNRTGPYTNPKNMRRGIFSAPWQFFWADLLAMRVFGQLLNELPADENDQIVKLFSDLSTDDRFLNNFSGTNNCTNYVAGIDRECIPAIDPLICAGSVVRVKKLYTSTSGTTAGLKMALLDAFDNNAQPPTVTLALLENDPRVLRATDIGADGSILDFPQIYMRFPWLQSHWVPYPFVARQECWFPFQDLEAVK